MTSNFRLKNIKKYFEPLRCHLSTLPFPKKFDQWWYFKSTCALIAVGCTSKLVLGLTSRIKVFNYEVFQKLIEQRNDGVSLLTACNHTSTVDDPGLASYLLPWKFFISPRKMRWSLAATEICFTNPFYTFVVSHGKVVPIVRGGGVYQPAMNFITDRLNDGEWIHIYPQGKITMDTIRLKWGIGRLIYECNKPLIFLPYWHCGMQDVMPPNPPYIPRIGKKVTVLFGEPIKLNHVIEKCRNCNYSVEGARKEITDIVQSALYDLKARTEELHSS